MECLSDRVIELLNHSEVDAVFLQFVGDVHSPISKALIGESSVYRMVGHSFSQIGVTIVSANTRFYMAQLHIEPVTMQGIAISAFSESLPFGVVRDSVPSDIQDLLGPPQERVNSCCGEYLNVSYQIGLLFVVFSYSNATEKLHSILISNTHNIDNHADAT